MIALVQRAFALLRRARDPRPVVPRHVEIWGHIQEQNVFLRRLTAAAIVLALGGITLGGYGTFMALHRSVAFQVDARGIATPLGRVESADAPNEAELRYVAKEFARRYFATNSLTLEADLAVAQNLMTNDLRAQHDKELQAWKAAHKDLDRVVWLKSQGIQTVLKFDDSRLELTRHDGGRVTSIHLVGTAEVWPLSRGGANSALAVREFDIQLTLVRTKRTEGTPNGLLVHAASRRLYEGDALPKEDP